MAYKIYKIDNGVNGKCYIGFTSQPIARRLSQHFYNAIHGGSNTNLSKAIRKYGKEAFAIGCLFEGDDRRHVLHVMEPYFIEVYDSRNNGYNMTEGGGTFPMYQRTDQHRTASAARLAVVREKNKGKVHVNNGTEQMFLDKNEAQQYIEEGWRKGPLRDLSYSRNLSKALTGRVFSDEHRAKISASLTGKKRTDAHCENLRKRRNITKSHIIINPDGETCETNDLKSFCKKMCFDYESFCATTNGGWKYRGYGRVINKDRLAARKRSKSDNGLLWTEERKSEHRDQMKGSGNNNAKLWEIKNLQTGEEITTTCLKDFCREHALNYSYALTRNSKPYKGWSIKKSPSHRQS